MSCNIETTVLDALSKQRTPWDKPIVDQSIILDNRLFGLFNADISRRLKEEYQVNSDENVFNIQEVKAMDPRADYYGYRKPYTYYRWRLNFPLIDELEKKRLNPPAAEGVKPGVEELFESNPELANQVYEALGLDKKSLLETVGISLGIKINTLSDDEIVDYLKNNRENIRFDFLEGQDKINNDKIYNLIKEFNEIPTRLVASERERKINEINTLIKQSKNLAINNYKIPGGIKFTNTGYTIITNAVDFSNITFDTKYTVKIKSSINSRQFRGINVSSNIIADNAPLEWVESANRKRTKYVTFKKISKYQSILNTGLAPKKNFEHTVLITNNPPLGYTLGLEGDSWNIEIGADTDKFPKELYEKFRIEHMGGKKLSIDKPLGWVGGKIVNDTLVITELQSDLLQNTFEIPSKISGVSKSAVENYFDGWQYVFLQTAINQMIEKYPSIKFVSLPSSSLYASRIPGSVNISKLYDKLSEEYNFTRIRRKPLNIKVTLRQINSVMRKGFTVTDSDGNVETFTIYPEQVISDKGYSRPTEFNKFSGIVVNQAKGGYWRIYNEEKAINILQNFVLRDSYFNKYQDNKLAGFNTIKVSELSKPIINTFTKEYYDVYIKTYLKAFVKEMKISNPELASEFELAYDAIDFSKDDINLKQFYNSEQGKAYLEELDAWIEKEFSKEVPSQDIADTTNDGGVLVDSEGNEVDDVYEETEIDKLIRETTTQKPPANFSTVDQDFLLDELSKAIQEKNKVRQDVIKQILTELNTKGESSIKYDNNGKIQGFVYNGNIFLNRESANKTLIEEAAHLWLEKIKVSNNALYREGLNKVKDSKYLTEVLNNSFYVKEALKLGNENSRQYQDYILNEALSKAIKDEGAKLSPEERTTFLDWLKNLYSELLKLTGLKNKSISDVKKMSLSEFSKQSLYDIFNIEEKGTSLYKNIKQQKQRALQLYSEYLDTGKQDIEGFKNFIQGESGETTTEPEVTPPTTPTTTPTAPVQLTLDLFREENSNMPDEDIDDYYNQCKI